jgi:protein TonB
MLTTAFFVLLLHGVLILGVTFSSGPFKPAAEPTFAVTLVQSRSAQAPDDARYIAQANHVGHGNTDKHVRPVAPVSQHAPGPRKGLLNAHDKASRRARARPSIADRILTTHSDSNRAWAGTTQRARASLSARRFIARLTTRQANAADPTDNRRRKAQASDKNPRHRAISVNTRESRFARYLDAWRKQVTRIGNLNYPQAIRSRRLSGRLRLKVALNADGSLRDVKLIKPSKHAELNHAAMTIVRAGAPYPPFPKSIKKDTDVLTFVYEWRFINGQIAGGK